MNKIITKYTLKPKNGKSMSLQNYDFYTFISILFTIYIGSSYSFL